MTHSKNFTFQIVFFLAVMSSLPHPSRQSSHLSVVYQSASRVLPRRSADRLDLTEGLYAVLSPVPEDFIPAAHYAVCFSGCAILEMTDNTDDDDQLTEKDMDACSQETVPVRARKRNFMFSTIKPSFSSELLPRASHNRRKFGLVQCFAAVEPTRTIVLLI